MTDFRTHHQSGFQFQSMIVREMIFQDAESPPTDTENLQDLQASIEVSMSTSPDARRGTTVLRFGLKPPVDKPELFRSIFVVVEGTFTAREQTTVEFNDFLNKHAPAIMFPFVRELIASIASRTRFGHLLLPPMNIAAMIADMNNASAQTVDA